MTKHVNCHETHLQLPKLLQRLHHKVQETFFYYYYYYYYYYYFYFLFFIFIFYFLFFYALVLSSQGLRKLRQKATKN